MSANKLLIFHQGALGDLVTLFPLFIRLRGHYQAIDVICKHQIGQLARHLRFVDTTYPAESAVFSSLFGDGPVPPQLDMLGYYSTILLFSYSAALHQRVCSLTGAGVHLIPPRPSPEQQIHITDHYADHMERLAILPRSSGAAEKNAIYRDCRRPGFNPKRVVLHPGSGSRRKNWPLGNFLSLCHLLEAEGFESTFFLGPAEAHLSAALPNPVERPADLVALAESLRTAGAFIGNDSGATHLAAFLGLPTVAVFGPSDPLRWRPLGRAAAIVPSLEACAPCFETSNDTCQSMDCLELISPATVMETFHNLSSVRESSYLFDF